MATFICMQIFIYQYVGVSPFKSPVGYGIYSHFNSVVCLCSIKYLITIKPKRYVRLEMKGLTCPNIYFCLHQAVCGAFFHHRATLALLHSTGLIMHIHTSPEDTEELKYHNDIWFFSLTDVLTSSWNHYKIWKTQNTVSMLTKIHPVSNRLNL